MNANFGRQMNFNGNRQAQGFGGMNNRQAPDFSANERPTFDEQQAPSFGGEALDFSANERPTFDAQQVPSFGGEAPTFDGQQPPMWGNENFAGEEIFKGEDNFAGGNPTDLTEVVDTRVDNASDFSEQKMFGNFGRGGFMPAMFGGQGGGFGQAQQPRQNHFR